MGTKYATILVGGEVPDYNKNPPSDDGSQTEANRVKYSTIETDIGNPLDAGIKDMDAKLVAHVNEGPDTETGTVTLTTADHNKVLECSGTFTLDLPAPAGNQGFQCTVKNAGSGVITIEVDGGANIDGGSSITLAAGAANKVYVNNAESAYYSVTGNGIGDGFASGTKMIFEQNAAPTGWTKQTDSAYNNTAMRVSTGTVSDVTSGSVDFDTLFGTTATDGHTLTGAESGTSAHTHPEHGHRFVTNWTAGGTSRGWFQEVTAAKGSTPVLSTFWTGGSPSNPAIEQTETPASSAASAASAHSHDIDLQVRYRDVIVAEKD